MVGNPNPPTGAAAAEAAAAAGVCPHPRTERLVVVATAAELISAVACPDCDAWLDTEISPGEEPEPQHEYIGEVRR